MAEAMGLRYQELVDKIKDSCDQEWTGVAKENDFDTPAKRNLSALAVASEYIVYETVGQDSTTVIVEWNRMTRRMNLSRNWWSIFLRTLRDVPAILNIRTGAVRPSERLGLRKKRGVFGQSKTLPSCSACGIIFGGLG